MKSLLQSRTFWVAVVQGVLGVLVVVFAHFGLAGALLITKSLIDIVLRLDTDTPIGGTISKSYSKDV